MRATGDRAAAAVGDGGRGLGQYAALARRLARHGSVHGIRAAGLRDDEEPDDSVADMTARYLKLLRRLPHAPTLLAGWSLGAVLSWEIAVRIAQHAPPPAVIMIDGHPVLGSVPGASAREVLDAIERSAPPDAPNVRHVARAHLTAALRHRVTTPYGGPALLVACDGPARGQQVRRWRSLNDRLVVRHLRCGHFEVFGGRGRQDVLRHVETFVRSLTHDRPS
ncbi:thioesterase domain-containing protein [Spirillospora sp. CA-255316]